MKRKLLEKAPLTDFADTQKTMIMMLLKQSIFRERLQQTNELLDARFQKARDQYCNDEMLLKLFKK